MEATNKKNNFYLKHPLIKQKDKNKESIKKMLNPKKLRS